MLVTPYYRTESNIGPFSCSNEPEYYYTPYQIFCLNSKLEPIVSEMFNSLVRIEYPSVYLHDKLYVSVDLLYADKSIIMNDEQITILQNYIDEFTSVNTDTCLLFKAISLIIDGKEIPINWVKSMLPYISIDKKYDPFYNQYGLCGNLKYFVNYTDVLADINDIIVEQLKHRYKHGYILGAYKIAYDWDLEVADIDGYLYKARWTDKRFADNIVNFLQSRMSGDRDIKVEIGENYVNRHNVALSLYSTIKGIKSFDELMDACNIADSFVFSDTRVIIYVDNLEQARTFTTAALNASDKSTGKVLTLRLSNLDLVDQYKKAADQLLDVQDDTYVVYYSNDTPSTPYIFSCKIPYVDNRQVLSSSIVQLVNENIRMIPIAPVITKDLQIVQNQPAQLLPITSK